MIYNYHNLDDLPKVVQSTKIRMRRHVDDFDSIVVRGVSGLLVGSPVALSLRKPLVVVRKPDEKCHDATKVVNAMHAGERAVFLDDFRSTGATEKLTVEALERHTKECRVVACYLYDDTEWPQKWVRPRNGWGPGWSEEMIK